MAGSFNAGISLDLTASFADVAADPVTGFKTPLGTFDSDASFISASDSMVRLVNGKLGGNVLQVELTNADVYGCFEQSMLEYSSLINSYQAKSLMADVLGSETGSLSGQEQKLARFSLALQKRSAEAYDTEALVGGTRQLFSSSITLTAGQQNYNLTALLSSSGEVTDNRVEIRELFHFSPTAAFRFFDTTSAINFLNNQFQFESFTPETIFYLLPIWEDVLRAQQLKQSHKIRRSNTSYNIVNNILKLFPTPTVANRLYFTYYLKNQDPFDDDDPLTNGVSNISNIPYGELQYGSINSMGQQWVRRMALAFSKEVLGQTRGKMLEVPIPNGSLTLNGPQLILESREEIRELRDELKLLLEETTYDKLAEKEMQQAEDLMKQLAKVPLGIFIG